MNFILHFVLPLEDPLVKNRISRDFSSSARTDWFSLCAAPCTDLGAGSERLARTIPFLRKPVFGRVQTEPLFFFFCFGRTFFFV
ncbi:hypothetical protein CEXT_441021 [Caerostris extrusa]|uniref:Uncharacterized protein n=1 Tax=Caerostris extrusa TaxID=172846 RepID=A0AAV4NE77_CAEEX|nr:hypothetical protein CEXT_441021 [Caerostris extrusa]